MTGEWDSRVSGMADGRRIRITGFMPGFPRRQGDAPATVRFEFFRGERNHVDLSFDPDFARLIAEDLIAMADVAEGRA